MNTYLRGLTAALLLPLPTAVLLAAAPAQAATTLASLEAERMTVLSGRVLAVTDRAATGGRAVSQRTNGTLSGSVTVAAPVQRLIVRMRGEQYLGAPNAVVRVDGVQVASFTVRATSWTSYVIRGSWPKGAHTVQIRFTNDFAGATGNRNLLVDRSRFETTTTSTTTPTSPPPTTTPTTTPTSGQVNDDYETRIVALVNAERAKAGLRALAVSPCIDGYAEEWSATMARTGQFQHRSDLLGPMRACSARSIGENIAYGNISADQMMQNWMGSAGHRANILNSTYTHIGVGATKTATGRVYGTQNFLRI